MGEREREEKRRNDNKRTLKHLHVFSAKKGSSCEDEKNNSRPAYERRTRNGTQNKMQKMKNFSIFPLLQSRQNGSDSCEIQSDVLAIPHLEEKEKSMNVHSGKINDL